MVKSSFVKYFCLVFQKIIETLISVKVLTIAAVLIITTFMVYDGKMSDNIFAQLNGSIIGVVYALRESFKIKKLKEYHSEATLCPICQQRYQNFIEQDSISRGSRYNKEIPFYDREKFNMFV